MAKKRAEVVNLGDEQVEVTEPEVTENPKLQVAELEAPSRLSPLWHDHVMIQFHESEVDNNGYPKVSGLRRVAEKLIGTIVKSRPSVVSDTPTRCSVAYRIVVIDGEIGNTREFGDVADATPTNIGDNAVGQHLLAVAGTRAEARTLRKMLGLRVLSSEEASLVKNPDGSDKEVSNESGFITPEQINYMEILCRRNDIDVWKYVNSGEKKYTSVEKIPWNSATKMLRYLTEVQTSNAEAPENIKGFEQSWRTHIKGVI